jgi:hypothetical protein
MLAILGLDCSCCDVSDIRTRIRLRNSNASALSPREKVGKEAFLELCIPKLDDGSNTKSHAHSH